MALLQVEHLKKIYTTRFGAHQVQALSDVSFSVQAGEFVAIMGESGSGKTTLLNILATLDRPTQGAVRLNGQNLADVPDKQLSAFRRQRLGFVFQDFNLLDTFSLKDNILLPLVLSHMRYDDMVPRLKAVSDVLGITQLLEKYPYGGVRRAEAARRGGPRADYAPGHRSGRRAHRRAGFQGKRPPAGDLQSGERGGADHSDGDPFHKGRKLRKARAVYQGWRGIP